MTAAHFADQAAEDVRKVVAAGTNPPRLELARTRALVAIALAAAADTSREERLRYGGGRGTAWWEIRHGVAWVDFGLPCPVPNCAHTFEPHQHGTNVGDFPA